MEAERERYDAAPSRYESPLACSTIGLDADWGLRHRVEAWIPDVVTQDQFSEVGMFLDHHATGHLPYNGGMMQQPARFVGVRRLLAGIISEITTARRMEAERNRPQGK